MEKACMDVLSFLEMMGMVPKSARRRDAVEFWIVMGYSTTAAEMLQTVVLMVAWQLSLREEMWDVVRMRDGVLGDIFALTRNTVGSAPVLSLERSRSDVLVVQL